MAVQVPSPYVKYTAFIPTSAMIGLSNNVFYDVGTDSILRASANGGYHIPGAATPSPISFWDTGVCDMVVFYWCCLGSTMTSLTGGLVRIFPIPWAPPGLYPTIPGAPNFPVPGPAASLTWATNYPTTDGTFATSNNPSAFTFSRNYVPGQGTAQAPLTRWFIPALSATTWPSAGSGGLAITCVVYPMVGEFVYRAPLSSNYPFGQ